MNHELIDDETLESLPDDPGMAFVMFERACRKSLMEAIEHEDSNSYNEVIRLDFMHDVIAAARFYKIPDLKDYNLPQSRGFKWEVFEDFNRRVRFFTTHYRLTANAQRSRHSVELPPAQKDRILTLVSVLRDEVEKADMPEWRRDRLRKSITKFEKTLRAKRLNFAEAMVFVGLLGAGLHGVGEGADGLGKLIHEITIAIGQAKEVEDTTRPALPAPKISTPVYLIEAKGAVNRAVFARDEMDDEIPF